MKSIKYNTVIAAYFSSQPLFFDGDLQKKPNIRKCVEQPFQQIKAQQWSELLKILCDLFFLEARAKAFLLDLQQSDYNEALSYMPDSENKKCISDYYWTFMHQKHFLKDHPELCFQQLYNQLQWKKDQTKKILEDAKEKFLLRGGIFLHQYAQPKYSKSNLIMTLSGHGSEVNYCTFSKDAKKTISGSSDATLKIWDAITGKITSTLNLLVRDWEEEYDFRVNCWAFSPDGKHIATGSSDGTFKIWNANTGLEIKALKSDRIDVTSCAYSPDGSMIIIGSWDSIELWDTHVNRTIRKFKIPRNLHTTCVFSPDGNRIIAGYSTLLKIWDTITGNLLMSLKGHREDINVCAYSPDGKYIASFGSDAFVIWNAETGIEVWNNPGYYGFVHCCTFSSDNQKIAFGGEDNAITIWNLKSAEKIVTFKGHSGWIDSCAFSPDNKQIISASSDETLKIWNLESAIESLTHNAHAGPLSSCPFSPDGEMVVSSGDSDRTTKIWSTKTGEVLTSMIGNKLGRITSCAFSPDGKRIASAHGKILELWDVFTGKKTITLRGGKGVIVISCAFSRDGVKLVSGCFDGSIIIWDIITGIQLMSIAKLTDCHLKMCTFSPDGKYIVSKVHSNNGNDAIIIWNTDTGNRVMIKNHRSSIFLLKEIFPDDEYFVTGKQKTLEITDFEKTNEILPLYEEKYAFTNSCFVSTENKKYLSNCLKISETDTAKEIIDFYTEGFCNSFSVSPDGTIIACGDNIGNFYLLKLVGFRIGTPIDREAKLFELVENYKSKILQGGWKSLSHKEHLWNEEFEEERYEVQMLNGEWKELEDFEPF